MKNKNLIICTLCLFALGFASLFLNSCSKDELDTDIEKAEVLATGKTNAEVNEKAANIVLELTLDEALVNEIYNAVDQRTLGETSILFEYLLNSNSNSNLKNLSVNTFATRFMELAGNGSKLKSSGGNSFNEFLNDLIENDVQIYWPYHDEWDGKTLPTVTFYDGINEHENVGYRYTNKGNIETVMVNEDYAWENPVWIINSYDGSPEEYLAMESEKKAAKTNEYYSKAALKNGSVNDEHVEVIINQVRCATDVTDYEGIFAGNLEMRWARGNVIDWENTVDYMKLPNNTVKFNFDRKRARNGWWTYVISPWVTDWQKTDPNYMMGAFEQDANEWKASGSGNIERKKSSEENVTVTSQLNTDIEDVKFTAASTTQTDSYVKVHFDWSVESKEGSLGSMEWTRSWVCHYFVGTSTVVGFGGIQCRVIVNSWNN